MAPVYDAIVIGAGGMGSATAFELALRGCKTLLLEQFTAGHTHGSSHGQTRIIRRAYYEAPAYVPLVQRAFAKWYDLEQRVGRHLLSECGCLNIGPPDGEIVQGVQASAAQHGLPIDVLDAAALREVFPPFRFDASYVGVLERAAGFLYVDACVQANLDAALVCGATLQTEEPVVSWTSDGQRVSVTTMKGTYHAAKLVLTAGAWATTLLGQCGCSLRVMRQVPMWFGVTNPAAFRRDVFPAFIADTPLGYFYGLPMVDAKGLKVAQHYGAAELPTPEGIDRTPRPADEVPVRAFLQEHIPDANGPLLNASTCLYTLTPDRHFVLDKHPEHANVVLAAGFSGHGFKFASVAGEVLADLVTTGTTPWDIGLFGLRRFAVVARET